MKRSRSGPRAQTALLLAISVALAAEGSTPAAGAPLDAAACEQLQSRLDALRAEGAATDMAQGPAWARANLSPERLQRIGALIEIEEQLNFRCGLAKARIVLPTAIEGGEEEIPSPGEVSVEGAHKTVVLPQKAPPAPKRPAAATAAATVPPKAPAKMPEAAKPPKKAPPTQKAAERAAKPATEAAVPKKPPIRKKQPKADDAYRPPPRSPQANEDGSASATRQ